MTNFNALATRFEGTLLLLKLTLATAALIGTVMLLGGAILAIVG